MMWEDDPKAYIETFEWHAIMTGLDKGYWASQLRALVVNKAQAACRALPQDEAHNYDWVKTTILYQLKINLEHYRRLYWAKKGPEENQPRLLLQLLWDLLNKWLSPTSCDRDTLADEIMLEQFMNDLEEHTQLWVHQHSPRNCDEALKLVEAFAASEVSYSRERHNPAPPTLSLRDLEKRQPMFKGMTRDMVCFRCRKGATFPKLA
ncbi:hypothetical protein Y1Q_0000962 [Alligator mississippiensis]|nr:hypothetical protein Y1Q_0000962 [Alligator mississippiensis]